MCVMEPDVELLLRDLRPSSQEERRARREEMALESIARYGRGSVSLQHARLLFDDELQRRKQDAAIRAREHLASTPK